MKCSICGEWSSGAHACPPAWHAWDVLNAEVGDPDDGVVVYAHDGQRAAEKLREQDHEDGERSDEVEVAVAPTSDPAAVETFVVCREYVPQYRAWRK